MPRFLSEDWIEQFRRRWAADTDLVRDLRRMDATLKYFVDGAEDDAVFVRLRQGVAVESGRAGRGSHDYVMSATLNDWKRLTSGEIGPKQAMATRRLKFAGSVVSAMRHIGPLGRSLQMMGEVPTDW
ncbi:MAG: sterol-binding protein [bacterium]|nr:sterol-binding protein [bacterium]